MAVSLNLTEREADLVSQVVTDWREGAEKSLEIVERDRTLSSLEEVLTSIADLQETIRDCNSILHQLGDASAISS